MVRKDNVDSPQTRRNHPGRPEAAERAQTSIVREPRGHRAMSDLVHLSTEGVDRAAR